MPQTVRITLNKDLEKSLNILRQYTSGSLNNTELIKLAIGSYARIKELEMNSYQKFKPIKAKKSD